VAFSPQRSEFEQLLCSQLLSLSEVAETLADRVLALDARLKAVEGQQIASDTPDELSEDVGDLLVASEEKVRMLMSRLETAAVTTAPPALELVESAETLTRDAEVETLETEDEPIDTEISNEDLDVESNEDAIEDAVEDAALEAVADDTEYVDDPQIDLLSA